MGRRGTDSEMGREVWRQVWHGEAAAAAEKTVPHSCVVDKNWERYLGSKQSKSQDRLHSSGFQCQENKLP